MGGAVQREDYGESLRNRDGNISSRFSGTPVLFVSFQSSCMKDRKEIEEQVAPKGSTYEVPPQVELLLDIRDLLQKLVEKGQKRGESNPFFAGIKSVCTTCLGEKRIINPADPHSHISDNVVKFNYILCPSCSPLPVEEEDEIV